jgi:carboxylesterase
MTEVAAGRTPKIDRGALVGTGDPSPRSVAGRSPAVLALHGYGGTALEVELVVDAAREVGLRAYAPLLPGHGTHASELARTGFDDWYGAAERAFDHVREGAPAIVVGFSMGSLLAAHLAHRRARDVVAIGMLSNATRLGFPMPDLVLRALDRLGLGNFSVPKVGADIADPEARRTHSTYGLQAANGGIEVLRAGERTEAILPRVHCPAFIAHGERDHVCPASNAARVARLIGSSDKTLLMLPRSFHIATRDYDKKLLYDGLVGFLRKVSKVA